MRVHISVSFKTIWQLVCCIVVLNQFNVRHHNFFKLHHDRDFFIWLVIQIENFLISLISLAVQTSSPLGIITGGSNPRHVYFPSLNIMISRRVTVDGLKCTNGIVFNLVWFFPSSAVQDKLFFNLHLLWVCCFFKKKLEIYHLL